MRKKLFALLMGMLPTASFAAEAAEGSSDKALFLGLIALASGLAIGLAGAGAGIGMGHAVRGTQEGMARNPTMSGRLQTIMFIGLAFIETIALYALFVVIIFVFTNVFTGKLG